MNASLNSPGWDRGPESHRLEGDFCPEGPALINLHTFRVSRSRRLDVTPENVPLQRPP